MLNFNDQAIQSFSKSVANTNSNALKALRKLAWRWRNATTPENRPKNYFHPEGVAEAFLRRMD
jgi:hypothetical protein